MTLNTYWLALAAAAGLVMPLWTPSAIAQPGEPPADAGAEHSGHPLEGPPPDGPPPREPPPSDPAAVRARIQNRIEEMRRQIEKSEAALKSLDEGASPEQVMESLGGPPGREGGPGRDAPMSRQDRERTRAFIKDHLPSVWERLELAEKGSPQKAERLLSAMRPRLAELMDLRRRDKTLFDLKIEDTRSFMLALESARDVRERRAAGAPPAELAAAEAKVRELVAASVDAQLRFKAHEIESLGGRIEELRKELDGLHADRDKIIDQRTKRLTTGHGGDDRPGGDRGKGGRRPQRPEPR